MKRLLLFPILFIIGFGVFAQKKGKNSSKYPVSLSAVSDKYKNDTIHIDDDSTHYHIDNLGENVNLGHLSSGPRISSDGKHLYFFKINAPENIQGTRDIWVSDLNPKDSSWDKAYHLDPPVNNLGANSVHWISPDGNKLLLHNIYSKNGTELNGVSMSKKGKDGKWDFPQRLKIKNYKNKDVCSFDMNHDESVLLMAINQKGDSRGKQDLYVSFKTGDLKYSEPLNLGPVINTSGAEATVFLAPDEKTIYFSSEGHPGSLGGFDIYESKRLDSTWTNWSLPRHIGVPFNTADNDFYFSAPDKTDYVYLSRHFGSGEAQHSDIIRIKIKETEAKIQLSGIVYDSTSKNSLKAQMEFITLLDNKVVANSPSDFENGYLVNLTGKKKFVAVIKADDYVTKYDTLDFTNAPGGYQKYKKNFSMLKVPGLELSGKVLCEGKKMAPTAVESHVTAIDIATGNSVYDKHLAADSIFNIVLPNGTYKVTYSSDICVSKDTTITVNEPERVKKKRNPILKKIEKDLVLNLENIYFEYNKADLLPESFPKLDGLYEFLKEKLQIKVEIAAHTDWVGNDNYNMDLSKRRAASVVKYLTDKGIPSANLVSRGYGETKPVADNKTPEGRAKNRRVEMRILEVGDLDVKVNKVETDPVGTDKSDPNKLMDQQK
ncbi:MAG: OmpA family protein [Cytophagales bacterium]